MYSPVVALNNYFLFHQVTEFVGEGGAKGTKVVGAKNLGDMAAKLKRPRRVMCLIKAGDAVDEFIAQLMGEKGWPEDPENPEKTVKRKLLEDGDIIIDGGNSEYQDTDRY